MTRKMHYANFWKLFSIILGKWKTYSTFKLRFDHLRNMNYFRIELRHLEKKSMFPFSKKKKLMNKNGKLCLSWNPSKVQGIYSPMFFEAQGSLKPNVLSHFSWEPSTSMFTIWVEGWSLSSIIGFKVLDPIL